MTRNRQSIVLTGQVQWALNGLYNSYNVAQKLLFGLEKGFTKCETACKISVRRPRMNEAWNYPTQSQIM